MGSNVGEAVRQFQDHVGAPAPTWPDVGDDDKKSLLLLAKILQSWAKVFKDEFKNKNKQVDLRCELIFEELAETMNAIAKGDKVGTLDGLVDTAYVVIGTATQFGLPFDKAFDMVHASNMTKSSAAARHAGDKGKGAGFVPANLSTLFDHG